MASPFPKWRLPRKGGGKTVEVRVVVATRKRWARMCAAGVYDPATYSLASIRWTPLVAAVQVTY